MQMSELAQKVENSAHELNNFLSKWDKLHTSGIATLNSIKLLKTFSLNPGEASFSQTYPPGLQEKCNELEIIIDELGASLGILQLLLQQLTALSQLDLMQNKSFTLPFATWSTEKFRAAFETIHTTYSQEFALKNFIKQEIAHCTRKDMILVHVAAWEFQPFINSTCLQVCRSLLLEAGVAPLC